MIRYDPTGAPQIVGEAKMKSILIADPDLRARQALTLLLERKLADVCVFEAWDRGSLEHQLAAHRPDALLLDCQLPGLSLADMAALVGRASALRMALMSVDADDIVVAQRLKAAFIYKGGTPDEAISTLRDLIEG